MLKAFNGPIGKVKGYETGITPFTLDELNKVCLQNATGSGKTLLMHVNFLQFRHYAGKSALKDDLTRTILITPNEGLSRQHAGELKASGIIAERLMTDSGDLLSTGRNGLRQVDFTEVTKLADQDGPNTIAVRNLGDQNLLLVDEAHRGMGSTEERGWFANRAKLAERGFRLRILGDVQGGDDRREQQGDHRGLRQVGPVRLFVPVFLRGRVRQGLSHLQPATHV